MQIDFNYNLAHYRNIVYVHIAVKQKYTLPLCGWLK